MASPAMVDWQPLTWASETGDELFARDYRPAHESGPPVLCLAGLSRNARDFHHLALHLATHPVWPRRVLAFDYRGRGRSAWCEPASYAIGTELTDTMLGLKAAGIERVSIVGTSRGGLIAMVAAMLRPEMIDDVVLNDVGPVVEANGLRRIMRDLAHDRRAASWEEAAGALAGGMGGCYPRFEPEDWWRLAEQLFIEDGAIVRPDHDPRLIDSLKDFDPAAAPVDLWPAFRKLASHRVLLLRGALSDILSAATVEAMRRVHPGLDVCVVHGQGHAPVLWEHHINERIAQFLSGGD